MNKIKLIFLSAIIGLIAVSCELEKFPYDKIEKTMAFKTMKDAASLRIGMYSQLRGRVDGKYMFTTDVQADQLNATLEFGNRNGGPHTWSFLAGDYTIRDVWKDWYNSLTNVNNFIENAGLIDTEGNEANIATLNKYIGEAYLLRAFYYHQLILRWGKTYNASTADTDPGVPLVLTYNINATPGRATVAEVYDQILEDIAQAKTLLTSAVAPPAKSSKTLTVDCVYALEARVKLCMNDYVGAAAAADQVIGTGSKYPLLNTADELRDMWVNDISTEVIFQLFCSQPSELPTGNAIYLGYNLTLDRYIPDFVPQQWVLDMYSAGDIRKPVYFGHINDTVQFQGADYDSIYLVTKYAGNPDFFITAVSNYMNEPKVFRVAEMYLISAEAKAHNPATEAAALTSLNEIRTNRGLASISVTGTVLMDSIKLERTRELFAEGFRLDDLKRWGEGFSRKTPQNVDFVITGADYVSKVVAAGADKFQWGIPLNDMTTNPALAGQQNPGW